MQKIILLSFVVLLVITIGEVGYYLYLQQTKTANQDRPAPSSTIVNTVISPTNIPLLKQADDLLSKLRTQPPEFYQIDRSFLDIYTFIKKDPNQHYYVLYEKKGSINNLQIDSQELPNDFCFKFISGIEGTDQYCLDKKKTIIFTQDSSGTQKTIPYTSLKNGDQIVFSLKQDMEKDNKDSPVELKIQVITNQ